jgi:hypothetical protein
VLPAALSAVLLSAFLLLKRQGWRITLDSIALRRLFWALLLILGITAARLLPQIVHADFVDHPQEFLAADGWSFSTIFSLFFTSEGYAGMDHRGIFYQYLMPPAFALLIVAARLLAG